MGDMLNQQYRVFTRNGEIVAAVSMNALLGCGLNGDIPPRLFDPRLVYDPAVHRWYAAVMYNVPDPAVICLAISAGEDPTGVFYRYQIPLPSGLIGDFPLLGFSDDKITVTAIQITRQTLNDAGYGIWICAKNQLLSNEAATCGKATLSGGVVIQVARTLMSLADQLLVGFGFNTVSVYKITGMPGSGQLTLGIQRVSLRSGQAISAPTFPAVEQRATPDTLLVGSGASGAVLRNSSLYAATTEVCMASGDTAARTCLRIVQLGGPQYTTVTQDIEMVQQGTHVFCPALAISAKGDLAVAYGASSPTISPSFYLTGRKSGDPLGTLRTPILVEAGQVPWDIKNNSADIMRWGDYFGAAEDPVYADQLWVAGQYSTTPHGATDLHGPARNFGTRIEAIDTSQIQ